MRRVTISCSSGLAARALPDGCVPSAYGRSRPARRSSGSRDKVMMSMPANVTDKASRRSRRPSHNGHGVLTM